MNECCKNGGCDGSACLKEVTGLLKFAGYRTTEKKPVSINGITQYGGTAEEMSDGTKSVLIQYRTFNGKSKLEAIGVGAQGKIEATADGMPEMTPAYRLIGMKQKNSMDAIKVLVDEGILTRLSQIEPRLRTDVNGLI